jgi:hypothetical protein
LTDNRSVRILAGIPVKPKVIVHINKTIFKRYDTNKGGILFWTDCYDCSWKVNVHTNHVNYDEMSSLIYTTGVFVFDREPKTVGHSNTKY